MKQSYFMKIYKRKQYFRLVLLFTLLFCSAHIIYSTLVTYSNNMKNPTIVKTEKDYLKAVKNNSYIEIHSNDLYDLGIQLLEITKNKYDDEVTSEKTKAEFAAINLDGKILLVSLPPSVYNEMMTQSTEYYYLLMGNLKKFKDEDLEYFKNSFLENGYSPEEIDYLLCENYLHYITLEQLAAPYLIFAVCIIIFAATLFIICINRNKKARKSLKNYSNNNLETVYNRIDNEITMPNVYKNGPITITQNYIIVNTLQVVFTIPLEEIMWVYRSTRRTRLFFKTNSIVFVFSDKSRYKVHWFKRAKRIDQILQHISENSPAIVGFSKELNDSFKSNPYGFIEQWKLKKQQYIRRKEFTSQF